MDSIFTTVLPELAGRAGVRARRLLPGPVTLIVPNPARRFRWLAGPTPERIGLRVPDLDPRLAAAIDRVGAIAATSANPTGHPAPRRLADVDPALLDRVAVALDGGEVGGLASTVIDLTGTDPVILREGPDDRRRGAPPPRGDVAAARPGRGRAARRVASVAGGGLGGLAGWVRPPGGPSEPAGLWILMPSG